jgi:hypothetical protein
MKTYKEILESNEKSAIKKWKSIAAKVMKTKPKTFMDFMDQFLEFSTEEDEDLFHWYDRATSALLDDVEKKFKKK